MKGFYISVKNDLLEPKHIQNMGESVWLYMWLLDKMTSVNDNGEGKILGNQPVTYALIQEELGIPERTYTRWVAKLKQFGYINTLRTPHGLCYVVNKASKTFSKSSAKSGVSKPKVIRHKVHSDTPNSVVSSAKLADVLLDNTKTIQDNNNNTNVLEPAVPVYGKPEINDLFSFWESTVGYKIESKVTANRRACSSLLKKHGLSKLQALVRGVAAAHQDKYAPGIADYSQLQQKTNELIAWGRKRQQGTVNSGKGIVL